MLRLTLALIALVALTSVTSMVALGMEATADDELFGNPFSDDLYVFANEKTPSSPLCGRVLLTSTLDKPESDWTLSAFEIRDGAARLTPLAETSDFDTPMLMVPIEIPTKTPSVAVLRVAFRTHGVCAGAKARLLGSGRETSFAMKQGEGEVIQEFDTPLAGVSGNATVVFIPGNDASCESWLISDLDISIECDSLKSVERPTRRWWCGSYQSSQNSWSCPGGSYKHGSCCSYCPKGWYCPGDEKANKCPTGKYGAYYAAKSCSNCPAGTYQDGGRTYPGSCYSCPAGKYSPSVSSSCRACPTDKYSPSKSSGCSNCPAAKYAKSDETGCANCPPGKARASDQTKCYDCAGGRYGYQYAQTSCRSCPKGKYRSGTGAKSSSQCTACNSGRFSAKLAAAYSSDCQGCEQGKYSAAGSSVCSLCAAGKYTKSSSSSSCESCPAGKISNSARKGCTDCAAGKYSNTGTDSSCRNCPVGYYCPGAKTRYACDAGKAQPSSTQSSCPACAAGRYAASKAASSCVQCSATKFQPLTGQSTCRPCYHTASSSTDFASCHCATGAVSKTGCFPFSIKYGCSKRDSIVTELQMTNTPAAYWKVKPRFDGDFGTEVMKSGKQSVSLTLAGYEPTLTQNLVNGVVHPGGQFDVWYNDFYSMVPFPCGCNTRPRVCAKVASRRRRRYYTTYSTSTKITPEQVDDAPRNIEVKQNRGLITFTWVVYSQCAVQYELTRKLVGSSDSAQIFTDLVHVPESEVVQSCNTKISPVNSFDDVRLSELQLGSTYSYCVTGTNIDYTSKVACKSHVVHFNSRVHVDVITMRGERPVEKAEVTWAIESAPSSCGASSSGKAAELTNKLGQTHFYMAPICLTASKYIVKVTVSKRTDGNPHIFKCADGSICDSIEIEVEHLNFDHKIVFRDASTAPVSGTVKVPFKVHKSVVVDTSTVERRDAKSARRSPSSTLGEGLEHTSVTFAVPDESSFVQRPLATEPVVDPAADSVEDDAEAIKLSARSSKAPTHISLPDTAFSGSSVVVSDAASANACQTECDGMTMCFGFSFLAVADVGGFKCRLQLSSTFKPVFSEGSTSTCSALHTDKTVCDQQGCIPGWTGLTCNTRTRHQKTFYSGSAIATTSTKATVDLCMSSCDSNSKCTAWSYQGTTCTHQLDKVWTHPGGIVYKNNAQSGCAKQFAKDISFSVICGQKAACKPGQMAPPNSAVCTERQLLTTSLMGTADLRAPAATAVVCAARCEAAQDECAAWTFCPSCVTDKKYPCQLYTQAKLTSDTLTRAHTKDAVSGCSTLGWSSRPHRCARCPTGFAGPQCADKVHHENAEPAYLTSALMGTAVADASTNWEACTAHCSSQTGCVAFTYRNNKCYVMAALDAKATETSFWARPGVTSGCSAYGFQLYGKMCTRKPIVATRFKNAVSIRASTLGAAKSSVACAEECDHDTACQAWTWNSKACYKDTSAAANLPAFQQLAPVKTQKAELLVNGTFVSVMPHSVSQVVGSPTGVAILNLDGTVATVMNGATSGTQVSGLTNVVALFSHPRYNYFVALRPDKSVRAWGSVTVPWTTADKALGVFMSKTSFAVIGDHGDANRVRVFSGTTGSVTHSIPHVVHIATTDDSYTAITLSGALHVFGVLSAPSGLPAVGFKKVVGTDSAFCAMHGDGRVFVFGSATRGGKLSADATGGLANRRATDIVATAGACAALCDDGSVYAWGDDTLGGAVPESKMIPLKSRNVKLHATEGAFIVLSSDGRVTVWGDQAHGDHVETLAANLARGIEGVLTTFNGFAAVTAAGGGASYVAASALVSSSAVGEIVSFASTDSNAYGVLRDGSLWASGTRPPPKTTHASRVVAWNTGVLVVSDTHVCYDPTGSGLLTNGPCVSDSHVSSCSQRSTAPSCTAAPCPFGSGGEKCSVSLLREGLLWYKAGTAAVAAVETAQECASKCEKTASCMGWSFLSDPGSGLEETCHHHTEVTSAWSAANGYTGVDVLANGAAVSACSSMWLAKKALTHGAASYKTRQAWCEKTKVTLVEHTLKTSTAVSTSLVEECVSLSAHACDLGCKTSASCKAWTHRGTVCHMFGGFSRILFDDGLGGEATSGVRQALAPKRECPTGRTGTQCEKHFLHHHTVYQAASGAAQITSNTVSGSAACAASCESHALCDWWTLTTANLCALWKANGGSFVVMHNINYRSACSRRYLNGVDLDQRMCWRQAPTPIVPVETMCALPRARVCVYNWFTGSLLLCEVTDATGKYEMHVPIDQAVFFVASFGKHKIELAAHASVLSGVFPGCASTVTTQRKYFVLGETGLFGVNFIDTTTNDVTITLAGGVPQCNAPLGSAEFLVLPRFACDQDDPLTLMHVADGTDDVTHRFTLPATLVDIKLNKVYERPEVAPYFDRVQSRMRNGVDLREFDEEDWEKSVTMDLSSGGGASPGSELSLSMCDKPVDDKTPPSGPVNKAQMAKILAAEAEAEKADAERYYRFEYHTRPNLNVVLKERVAGDAEFTEGDSDVKTSFNAKCAAAQKSFPVILGTGSGASVTPATTATFTITASEDYGDGNTCNFVDGSVQIVNRVGTTETVVFSEHDASGEAPASEEDSKKDASPQPADVAACAKPPGCTARLSVSKAVRGSPKPDNYLSVPEIVVTTIEAEPERNAAVSDPDTPHTKSFYATMNVPGWQTLSDINHIEMNIAVLGLVRLSAFFSLTLPEYLPVMILRDPPGGGSSASISGDKSVAYGNGASLEISGGLGVQGEVGITSGETLTLCVGLGVAVCKSGFDLDTEVTLGRREAELRRQARKITASSVKTGKQVLKKIQAEDEPGSIFGGTELGYGFNRATTAPTSNWEETRELSFGFAASTSGEPPNPGRGSDMYLVPSLSVKLTRSLDIKYNVDDCAVEAAPVVDLDPNGKKVLAWQTENDIRYRLLTDLLAQLAVEIKKDFDYEARLNLMNAINGWVSMLAYNGAVHHAAAQKGSEWAEFEEEIKVDKSSMTLSDSGVALDVLFSDHELSMSSRKLLKYSNAAKAYIEALKAWGTQNSKMFGAEQEDEKRPGLPPINTLRMQSGVKKFEGDEAVAYEDAQGLSPDGWTKNAGEGVDAASLDAHDWVEEEKDILEAATPNRREAPSLSDYHGVSFSGGGQTISYTVGGSYSKENSKSETWEHTITLPTLKFHFELQVGAGLDLDISIPSELKFVHGTSSSSAVGTSNEVSFELSDGDALDEFNVLIFWDPMFGTPVFHTISGRSMCVHEKNTAAREGARIQLVSWPTGPVMPGETAIFEILLIQDSSTGESSIYELDMPSDYNPYNLVPLVDGDTLIAPLVFNDFPSGSKRMTLNIDAGPELSKYPPFRLKFGSACEREMYFAGATSPDYSIIEGVIDIPVEWLEACPAVSFAGELVEEGSFVVNAATRKNGDWQGKHKDQLRVVAQNPAVVDQSWKTDGRLLAVDLEYRKEGTSTWKKATFKQSDETLEAPEKGGLQTLESSFGYATVYWNVATVPDGAYELRLHTTCSAASMENPPPTINEQFSAILKGVLDREAPQVFGRFAQPASGVYKPGSSISVTFTERIDCQQPSSYEVRATVTPPGKSAITLSTLGVNELQVICSGHSIHIEFGVAVPWDTLEGANVAMSVINVRDVAGNVKETASQWQFTLEGIDVNKAKASVTHVKLSRRLDSTVIDEEAKEHCAAAVRSELERMLGVRGGRVSVRVETVTRENEPIVSIDIGAPQGVHEASTAALLGKLNTMLWQGEKDFGKSNSTRPLSANLEHAGYDWLSRVNTAVRSRVQLMSEGAGAPLSGGSDGSSSGSLSNRNTLILVGVLVAGVLLVVLHSRYQSRRQAKLVLAALGSPKGSESVALLAESVL